MAGWVQAPSGNHSNGTGVIEIGIDLMRGSDLNRAPHLPVWNPNQQLERARSADDRSHKSAPKANAFVVSLIWVF